MGTNSDWIPSPAIPRASMLAFGSLFLLTLSAEPTAAADRLFQVVTNANVVNHWPAPDGLIGTTDDVVSANLSALNASAPDGTGTYSYNAFNFGNGPEPTLLPPGMDAVTFIQGSVTVDGAVAQSGGGPLIKGWSFSGTEPFPGHGAYSAQITQVNSGAYNPATKAFSENLNFLANLHSGTAPATNFTLTGSVYVVDAANFVTTTGNAYVDNVLIPLAKDQNAKGLFFAQVSGTVPASSSGTGGSFPQMPIAAVVVALDLSPPPLSITLSNVAVTPTGIRLAWNAQAGQTYSVESTDSLSAAFATLSTNLAGPFFVDTTASGHTARFYRVRSP